MPRGDLRPQPGARHAGSDALDQPARDLTLRSDSFDRRHHPYRGRRRQTSPPILEFFSAGLGGLPRHQTFRPRPAGGVKATLTDAVGNPATNTSGDPARPGHGPARALNTRRLAAGSSHRRGPGGTSGPRLVDPKSPTWSVSTWHRPTTPRVQGAYRKSPLAVKTHSNHSVQHPK